MEPLKLKHNFHVIIFNWSRHHRNALMHEHQFKRFGIKASVINSSSVYHEKHWHKLDDGYFAEQWNTLLKVKNSEADYVVHIQADAYFLENIKFIQKLDSIADAFDRKIGIYAPNIDFTYHRYDVSRCHEIAPRIHRVPNTDCTYWAINNDLLRFNDKLFDLNKNFFGFGADWYYSALCEIHNMYCVRDYNFKVKHEHSTGYDINKALIQLEEWIKDQPEKIQLKINELMARHKWAEV